MKILIDEDEQYPFYRIVKADAVDAIKNAHAESAIGSRQLGIEEVEVSSETIEHWNIAWTLFWAMQSEMMVLYEQAESKAVAGK